MAAMRIRGGLWAITTALAAAALLAAPTAARAGTPAHRDAAVRQLRAAITTQRDGSHLSLLSSLRQLRDPDLRPILTQLVGHRDWHVQAHAVLGLAEIDPAQRVDPALVRSVQPLAQEAIIASGLDLGLIGEAEIAELLAWTDLPTMPRLLLHAERTLLGRATDLEELRELAGHEELHIAGLALLLLAQHGQPEGIEDLEQRLASSSWRDRRRALPWLSDAIRQYRLDGALPWLRSLLEESGLDEAISFAAVHAAVAVDPPGQIDLWERALGPEPGYRERVNYGLMLLACGPDVPAEAFDRISGDEELIAHLIAAGKSVARRTDATAPIIALVDLGHPRSTERAIGAVEHLDEAQAERIYLHLIERAEREGGGRAERTALAVKAVSRLFETNPEAVMAQLEGSDPDSLSRQVVLLGLLDSSLPAAGQAAEGLPRRGFGRADSLAMLLRARHADALSPDELRQLGLIASGGGRVSEVLQTQAAWLYLKHTGQVDEAVRRLFEQ